jgi:hypothetical protein
VKVNQKYMLEDFTWGPVCRSKHRVNTALYPLTPLKYVIEHIFLTFCKLNFLLIIPFIFVFLSCATVLPVTSSTVGTVRIVWQGFVEGVDFFHGRIETPKLEFWALRVELGTVEIFVSGGMADDSGTGTLSTRVSSFVNDNGLIAGINAAPFDVSSAEEGQPIRNVGIIVSGGQLIAPADPRYDALVFYSDGTVAIVGQSEIQSIENIENAVGAFHHILVDGEFAERTLTRNLRHPRSAAGISACGEYLYLLAIDGRRPGSVGATEIETAMLLLALGSWNGINLDGGGSTALALRYPDGKVRVVNTPVHGLIPGQERAVAGSLGILQREPTN